MAIGSISATDAPDQIKSNHPVTQQPGSAIRRKQIRSAVKRLLLTGCLGISAIGMTGCTLGSRACKGLTEWECIDDFMVGYRNRAMAEKAWHCRKANFCDSRYAGEFKDGFIKGYLEVASGGTGCTPLMAPSAYHGWQYQTADGHSAVNAWFQGFPQGVRAAEEDGVGNWQSIGMGNYRQPAPIPAAIAPAAASAFSDSEESNPFYSDEDPAPEPDPATSDELEEGLNEIIPGRIEEIDVPGALDSGDAAGDGDSVFDGLFPPVAVGDAQSSPADAVIAEGSVSDDQEDGLSFSFE